MLGRRVESLLRGAGSLAAASTAVAAALAAALGACGTGASSPGACRAIEEARCQRAPACNLPLQPPYSTSGTTVAACIRYYDVACLHGLDVSNPGQAKVNECVEAINTHACTVVSTPESDPACAWLVPAATVLSDAASDADATSADAEDAEPDGADGASE